MLRFELSLLYYVNVVQIMTIPKIEELNSPTKCMRIYFKKNYPEFLNYLESNYPEDLKFSEKLYLYYNSLSSPPKCKCCENKPKFVNLFKGYLEYCSTKCSNSDPNKIDLAKDTCLKKYGGVAPACSFDIKQKMKQTCEERYGYSNALQVPEKKEKVFDTITKRYGGIGKASSKLNEKFCKTMMKKYGTIYCSQVPEVADKIKQTNISRYGVSNPCLLNPHSAPVSSYEQLIRGWLDEWNIEYVVNRRDIIPPKELDIFIPSLNIGIEFNGVYWHSDLEKPASYHIDKFKECKQKGIQLIQIWEDWLHNKSKIVKSFLQSKIGICNNKTYARNCIIKEIDRHTAIMFLEQNHIQGRCNSNYNVGLFYNDDLVAIMCFNKRSSLSGPKIINNEEIEIVRFCNKLNMRVVGGAGKLLKYYIKKFRPKTITSYSSNDISNGKLYKSLGFITDEKISSGYWYIEPVKYNRFHRSTFSRSGIAKKWPEYNIDDKSWTETSAMRDNGYLRIYDSGTTKWVLNI